MNIVTLSLTFMVVFNLTSKYKFYYDIEKTDSNLNYLFGFFELKIDKRIIKDYERFQGI